MLIKQTGIYICIASNSHGQVERDFQLTVLGIYNLIIIIWIMRSTSNSRNVVINLEPPEQPRHLQIQVIPQKARV